MSDEPTVREVGGYLIRVKKGATSPAGISFVLPKDRKEHLKHEKQARVESKNNVKNYIEHTILPFLKEKCSSMTEQEKHQFLKDKFKVNSFSDLEKYSVSELRGFVNE